MRKYYLQNNSGVVYYIGKCLPAAMLWTKQPYPFADIRIQEAFTDLGLAMWRTFKNLM